MDKTEITALLEALCERPLADRRPESAELEAFCRKAAKVLSQPAGDGAGAGPDSAADTDRLTAALAVLLSAQESDEALRTVEEAVLRSEAARLDAQSALAFVDVMEQSPQAAPAHLFEEFLAADRAAAAGAIPHERAGGSILWSLIAGASWSVRRWRMAAASTVLVAAGVASWSVYWQQTNVADQVPAVVKTLRDPPALGQQPTFADAPAPPRPATARTQPCEQRGKSRSSNSMEAVAPGGPARPADASADASCPPDQQLADRPADELDVLAARQRAEAARQAAAAAQAAVEAAGKVGAARADRERDHGALQADRAVPVLGEPGRNPPAAASRVAPTAVPAIRPAAPAVPLGIR